MGIKLKIKQAISFLLHGEPDIVQVNLATLAPNELLKGRCALITGGTSGIGFAIAQTFLNAGAAVILTGRNQEKLDSAIQKLESKGRVWGYTMNNLNIETFEPTFNQMLTDIKFQGLKHIDILVNNAGVLGAVLPNATEKQYDKVLDTNLKAVFFLSQMFGKYMVKNKIKGNILNIASSSSLRPAISAYIISKWGIKGFTMGLAKSLIPYGITVNGIAPGRTATPMLGKREDSNMLDTHSPLGRWIMPEEIANGALFLVSNLGKAIVGDIIYMTGSSALLSYDDMNYNVF